jgi:hypothetical protein
MHLVIGPVLTRKRGYAFDSWTPEDGLACGFVYRRIEDAYYARNFEIKARSNGAGAQTVACATVDEFVKSTIELPITNAPAYGATVPQLGLPFGKFKKI